MEGFVLTVERTIQATPEAIFDILAKPFEALPSSTAPACSRRRTTPDPSGWRSG